MPEYLVITNTTYVDSESYHIVEAESPKAAEKGVHDEELEVEEYVQRVHQIGPPLIDNGLF